MVLTRQTWVLPGQRCTRISLSPVNYAFQVQAMSGDKLPFILPTVFTLGPRADDPDSLLKYARLVLSSHGSTISTSVTRLVEGETRALAASMTMEDIVKDTRQFMRQVLDKVHVELAQVGLHVHNANVKHPVGEKVGPKLTRQNAAKFDAETKNLSTALTATEKLKAQKVAYLGQKQKEAEAEAEYQRKKKVEGELRWRDTSTLRRRKPSSSPL